MPLTDEERAELDSCFEAIIARYNAGAPWPDPFSYISRLSSTPAFHDRFGIGSQFDVMEYGSISAKARLPIDDELEQLRENGTEAVKKHLQNYRTLIWPPPFAPNLSTRHAIEQAISIGAFRFPNGRRMNAGRLQTVLDQLTTARKAVQECLDSAEFDGFPSGENGLPWEQLTGRWHEVANAEKTLESSVRAIDFIIDGVQADLSRLNVAAGRPKEEWKMIFVASLALCWEAITGKLPGQTTTTGSFVSFLHSAWNSLPYDPPEVNWERAIRQGVQTATQISDEIKDFIEKYPEELRNLYRQAASEDSGDSASLINYYTNPFTRLRERTRT